MNNTTRYSQKLYGHLPDDSPVTQVQLRNASGLEVTVISYGGIITRIATPDRFGTNNNIVLGLDCLEDYLKCDQYLGALIGRYGNRIARGRFELQGRLYQLPTNDGGNHLHGAEGFHTRNWDIAPFSDDDRAGVRLALASPDGDQGYPGNLDVSVIYTLSDDDTLEVVFSAGTDTATVVNLTQHSYFNLAGRGDILAQELAINADNFTPVGEGLIPTGEILGVADSPFDFRQPVPIGQNLHRQNPQLEHGQGFDHNFVLNRESGGEMTLAARASDRASGRVMELWTEEPGLQFYSGNALDGSLTGNGRRYHRHNGFCLEPQHYPDSPNQPQFPGTALYPGEEYRTRSRYRFALL